jgi:hypothetical protein
MLENMKEKVKKMTTPSKVKVTMRAVVGIITICGFVSVAIYLVAFHPTFESKESIALVGTVVGYLSAKADTIIGWYYGSSQSSVEKSDAMETWLKDDKLD